MGQHDEISRLMVSSKDLDNVTHSELVQKFGKSYCTFVLGLYETQRRRCLKTVTVKVFLQLGESPIELKVAYTKITVLKLFVFYLLGKIHSSSFLVTRVLALVLVHMLNPDFCHRSMLSFFVCIEQS